MDFLIDRACLDLFRKFGVTSEIQPDGILINHSGKFAKNLSIDFTSIPDLAQAVAITAAGLRISLEMKGLSTLRHKETDRISALQSELAKFGVYTSLLGDDLLIGSGFQPELSPVINTFDDHRMAMGFAALAAKCPKFFIDNPKVVAKSFPNFWSEFMKLGVDIKTYT